VEPFVLVVVLIIVAVFAIILVQLGKGVGEWLDNNRRPIERAPATVSGKRSETRGMSDSPVRTYYYATFEFDSGERQEFSVGGHEYGLLSEGDRGWLTFQGTRYHGFERARADA
jgi:hypothetical protein